MSQFTWESERVDEAHEESHAAEPHQPEAAGPAGNLALSPDDFSALE